MKFLVVLVGMGPAEAQVICERLREDVAAQVRRSLNR